jgi:hypothetical protein
VELPETQALVGVPDCCVPGWQEFEEDLDFLKLWPILIEALQCNRLKLVFPFLPID